MQEDFFARPLNTLGCPEGEHLLNDRVFRHAYLSSVVSYVTLMVCELASPRGSWLRSRLKGQGMGNGGRRPPDGQPSLDGEGVDEVDGWDD